MELVIDSGGECRFVYDEGLDLRGLGKVSILRGSHVEPSVSATWIAALSPVNGPLLGPFAKRSEALVAESEWLAKHWPTANDR